MMPMPQVDEVPPPPPRGPGVLAPFSSPPRDRDLRGLWWGLGIGGVVLVLCCVGGVVGIGFAIPYLNSIAQTQVSAVVEDYLTDLKNEDFPSARRLLCEPEQRAHSLGWFEDHFGTARVTEFTVDADRVSFDPEIVVPARVTEGGSVVAKEFVMQQDGTQYVICGGVD
jgi:hypothetical protein